MKSLHKHLNGKLILCYKQQLISAVHRDWRHCQAVDQLLSAVAL